MRPVQCRSRRPANGLCLFHFTAKSCVHGFYQILEGLVNVIALDFHGGGYLAVFFIKFLWNDRKLAQAFHSGKGLIDPFYFGVDQSMDGLRLGQIFVC